LVRYRWCDRCWFDCSQHPEMFQEEEAVIHKSPLLSWSCHSRAYVQWLWQWRDLRLIGW
jgi:hypothetical protein